MDGKPLILTSLLQLRQYINGGFVCLLAILAVFLVRPGQAVAFDRSNLPITRGEVVSRIVDAFDLGHKKESFLGACQQNPHECFFVFSAMSDYDDIAFEPFLKLYPDVHKKYRYYEAINIASMLGLIHGYLDEEKTPFKPEASMTRIQALKVLLGASDLLRWKERFELSEEQLQQSTPFVDTALSEPDKWWYNRYLNFAYEKGIVPEADRFRPDEPITFAELQEMIDNTLAHSEALRHDTKTVARGDSAIQTDA